jgi:microcystin-dependent protein
MRARSRGINNNTYYDNNLTTFTNPPIHTGDLYVKGNETVGGNLEVTGSFRTRGDLWAKNVRATNTLFSTDILTEVVIATTGIVTGGNVVVDGSYNMHDTVRHVTYSLIPPGTVLQSAAVTSPAGWLACDGASYSTTSYPQLFTSIGYTYGGSGVSFNVPDMRGNVVVGFGGAYSTIGATGGEETHQLTSAEIPSHSHTITRRANPDDGAFDTSDAHASESSACTTDREDLGLFSTSSIGSDGAHNNMQPYVVLRYLIKY